MNTEEITGKQAVTITATELAKQFFKKFEEDPARFDDLTGVTAFWTSCKLVILFKMNFDTENKYTHEDMANELGYERSTITKKINSIDWDEFAKNLCVLCSMNEKEYMSRATKKYRIEALARVAIKTRCKEINLLAQVRNLEELLLEGAAATPKVSLPPIRINTKRRRNRTPEYMVVLLSDMHVGLGFDDLDTGGLGSFNHEILVKRIANLRQGLIGIYRLHAELYPIPKLYVLSLGDNVQGGNDIGNWGCAYNTLPTDMQVLESGNLTSELLSTWSNVFEEVRFLGVGGNHGRMEKKNVAKVRANFDNLTYALIQARMMNHKNVTVDYRPAWWATEEINKTRFCLVHGDNVRNTINALVSEEQRIQSLIAGIEEPFKVLVAGHFHTHHEVETSRGRIILNGSFVGGDIHSMKNLRVRSRPTQTVMGVHPENGITWKYCLDLDHPREIQDAL